MVATLSEYRHQTLGPDIRVEMQTITPALAAEWLTRNTRNRSFRSGTVADYARDMAAGAWKLNGDAIRFAADGTLLDGQHRLAAIVQADVSVQSFVVSGLPSDVFSTIDTGRKRSMANVLNLSGESYSSALGGALRLLWTYRTIHAFKDNGLHAAPSHAELLALLNTNPGLRDSVVVGDRAAIVGSKSVATCLHYLFRQRDPELADLFFEALITGLNLSSDEPVYHLRQRLERDRASKRGLNHLTRVDTIRFVIKAWNLTRQGRRIQLLRAIESDPDANEI